MTSNTRDGERVPAPGQLTGEVTVYEPLTILDLSDRGALVETHFALHLDSLHEFRVSLGSRSVVVKGRIAHSQIGEIQEGTVLYRTGVEFVEPSEHALSAIHSFVEALKFAAAETPRIVEAELADEGN